MLLTGIKLINWHYFTNEYIPIAGSALIAGNNKAGKSTLIDALQVVLVSNMRKILFNSAAFDEKTARDLKGYLRGRTGTEGKYTYLRGNEEDFSSYIVLEFTRSSTQASYLVGAVFDYYCDTGEEEHTFFKIEDCRLRDGLFLQDGYPRNREQFARYAKTLGLNFRQYRNDLEGYRNDLRQLFGGIKEAFFRSLLKEYPLSLLRT